MNVANKDTNQEYTRAAKPTICVAEFVKDNLVYAAVGAPDKVAIFFHRYGISAYTYIETSDACIVMFIGSKGCVERWWDFRAEIHYRDHDWFGPNKGLQFEPKDTENNV